MKKIKYFGQNGEDCVLWSLFKRDHIGTFVDIGALDGMRFSNTYSFELAGWSGICVEAHPTYIPYIKKNRPKANIFHAAASNKDAPSTIFFTNKFGSLSTLDGSMGKYFSKRFGKWFLGHKKVKVPMRTVDTMLKVAGITKVDVVSVDVEGTEIDVLKGFSLAIYKPEILVLEALDKNREQQQHEYMRIRNYHFSRKLSNNLFFCRTKEGANIARAAKIVPKNMLIHTKHPLH